MSECAATVAVTRAAWRCMNLCIICSIRAASSIRIPAKTRSSVNARLTPSSAFIWPKPTDSPSSSRCGRRFVTLIMRRRTLKPLTMNVGSSMDDNQLLRYSRQIMLPEIDIKGQARLLKSRVLIVGLGALGSPVSMYLAASGVGELLLMDHDRVELSNLQRQIVHTTDRIGASKVQSASATLSALNPEISVVALASKFNTETLRSDIGRVDAVVDA